MIVFKRSHGADQMKRWVTWGHIRPHGATWGPQALSLCFNESVQATIAASNIRTMSISTEPEWTDGDSLMYEVVLLQEMIVNENRRQENINPTCLLSLPQRLVEDKQLCCFCPVVRGVNEGSCYWLCQKSFARKVSWVEDETSLRTLETCSELTFLKLLSELWLVRTLYL